ncbi:MAG: CotH kinase family protein [Butyrivibrio sp.]|nr:CotH kinase family protein [Muribaculum sp.]MCM1552910.1 CotH kinase family protein [Butyrivibrio sp.]
MRKRKACLLMSLSLLAILLLMGFNLLKYYMENRIPVPYITKVMGIPVVESLDLLQGKQELVPDANPGVCFEGTMLPYDKGSNTLYLSQDFQTPDWVGKLSVTGREVFLCTLQDEAWQNKADAIRDSHVFTIWVVEEQSYYTMSMVISGMPVMAFDTERFEEQDRGTYEEDPDKYYFDSETLYYGSLQLFNPSVGVDTYEIVETAVRYHFRGASSAKLEKEGYALCLQDSKGENLDLSLLGMRSDNSWKLNAMSKDPNRIRDKTASQLWEQFALVNTEVNESGPRMEYLELVVDNEYKGLYVLMEPVDKKKLQLDKNDVLYKVGNWIVPEDGDIQYAIDHSWRIMSFIRIRHPDSIDNYEQTWYPMRDYLNTFYRSNEYIHGVENKIYLTNALDVLMFNMAISGSDNYYKNLYFAADVNADGSYTMRQIPWDLDLTFGYRASEKGVNGASFRSDATVVYEEAAISYLRENAPDTVEPILQERWRAYRESFLSTRYIKTLMRDNVEYLAGTGVLARENARWPAFPMSLDIEYLLKYQEERMVWLDEYFVGEG